MQLEGMNERRRRLRKVFLSRLLAVASALIERKGGRDGE
jgi:hypothetical protein